MNVCLLAAALEKQNYITAKRVSYVICSFVPLVVGDLITEQIV